MARATDGDVRASTGFCAGSAIYRRVRCGLARLLVPCFSSLFPAPPHAIGASCGRFQCGVRVSRGASHRADNVNKYIRTEYRTGRLRFVLSRIHPLTCSPEADETKTKTVALPQHACVPLSGARQHRPARSSCADALVVRSAPLNADTARKSEDSSTDALFTPELMASMQPTIS